MSRLGLEPRTYGLRDTLGEVQNRPGSAKMMT